MKVKRALAALPLVLNACGGDNSPSSNYTPNELGQGIWKGGFSSSPITVASASGSVTQNELTQIEKEGVGLFTTDNNVFFYNVVDDILFTHTGNQGPGFFSGNLVYSPTYYSAGNDVNTVSIDGNANISTSIIGQISSPIPASYVMIFDNSYFRGADLSRLSGRWSYSGPNGDWVLNISSSGAFYGTSTKISGCTFSSGAFSLIDFTKNEYAISVTLDAN